MDLEKIIQGYKQFRKKYVQGSRSVMKFLAHQGQQPETMIVTCSDSRVDPALIFQCDPGELFVVRNVANIVPPYEKDLGHHGVSAALEYGIRFLKVKQLIILGHSHCGGIQARFMDTLPETDFIHNWVVLIDKNICNKDHIDDCAKLSLQQSYENCLQFPWIKERSQEGLLDIKVWFFDIEHGNIEQYNRELMSYQELY